MGESAAVKKPRDHSIDLFRALGMLLIVLAHVECPHIVMQLRNFDVVLMVIVMGMSYRLSAHVTDLSSYGKYVVKRFRRLVIPAWIFLIVYFAVCAILNAAQLVEIQFTAKDYLHSFLLLSGEPDMAGLGFVWILRVYFLVSLLLPLLDMLRRKRGILFFAVCLLAAEAVYLVLQWLVDIPVTWAAMLWEQLFCYGIGYGVIAGVGLLADDLSPKQLFCAAAVMLLLYGGLLVYYRSYYTQPFKYPPQLYYLAYAMLVCFLLLFARKAWSILQTKEIGVVTWISKNSLDLYLYHIIPIRIIRRNETLLRLNFVVQFVLVWAVTIMLMLAVIYARKSVQALKAKR